MSLVVGHRGASHDFPENTLKAFAGALHQGADWVELDVRRTADGVLVVHHDAALADGTVIATTVAADLPPLVPTLVEVFSVVGAMGVNVEIKNSPGEAGYDPTGEFASATVAEIEAHAGNRSILVSSFDAGMLAAVRAASPDLRTGYLVLSTEEPLDAIARAIDDGHQAVNPWDPCVTEASVRRAHDAGLAVNVWTVDDPDRIAQLAAWGVDAIITNRPAIALHAIGRRPGAG